MPKLLTPGQVAAYERDGFVAPITLFGADEAQAYRRKFEAYEAAHRSLYETSKGQKLYLLQTWARDLCTHPRVLDAVEDLLGPDLMVWGMSLFVKNPHDPGYVSWHQDATYWGLDKPDVVTAWIALSPATLESGCMKVVPGSHKWPQMEHRDTLAAGNMLTRGQEIAVDVNEDDAVAMPLQPGQMSLHHVMIAHASKPNASDDRRIGIAIRYMAPRVAQSKAAQDSAWLVRGEDRFGNFVLETPAEHDMDAAAMAEYARILKLRQGNLYQGVQGKPAHTLLADGG